MGKSENKNVREGYIKLEGSNPRPVKGKLVGPYDPKKEMTVTIILRPLPGENQEHDILRKNAPRISRREFAAKQNAHLDDVDKIMSFASEHGLTVVDADAARRTVILGGTVERISAGFSVHLDEYEVEGKSHRIQRGPIYIHPNLQHTILGVFGLDDRPVARPHSCRFEPNVCGTPLSTSFTPPQIAAAYGFPLGVSGKGQTIAILELGGGYTNADMVTYFNGLGISVPSITAVSVDGATNKPEGGQSNADLEVCLDIQICGAIASDAKIMVFFAPNSEQGFLDALSTAIHGSSNPSIISISWGNAEKEYSSQFLNSWNSFCQEAAWLGITILAASGDFGSSDGENDNLSHADFPASSPYVLGCGGTTITVAAGVLASEVVWNNTCGASGGGISDVFSVPAYQSGAGVPSSANPNGRVGRGVPDVAGNADPASGYVIRANGNSMVVGGTSAVSPLWAAYIALINEWMGDNLGLFNFRLYNNFSGSLRDVTIGSNGAYSANNGWDACTGFGSPSGMTLVSALECATVQHRIKPVKTECGLFGIQGGTVTLVEELVTVPSKATISYKWKVTAGASNIIGPDNHYSAVFSVPANNQNVSVSVSVSIDGCSFTDNFTFAPLDPDLASRLERFCRLRRFVHVNMFFNPLWDPLRDLVTKPLTDKEIKEMTTIIEHVGQLLEGARRR